MNHEQIEDAVISHLVEIANVKKAVILVARKISDDFPSDANLLLDAVSALTQSGDRLLGDTEVT